MERTDRPIGLSVWEEEFYDLLVGHARSEAVVLDSYQRLAADAPRHVKFLLGLILEDEERHHKLFEQWARTVGEIGELTQPADGVPSLDRERDPATLIAAVDELLAFERNDARQLKDLRGELKDYKETTMWTLLVDLMALDTEKHIRTLEFLKAHAKQTAKRK
jgi:rubrerythrin